MASIECLFCQSDFEVALDLKQHIREMHHSHISQVHDLSKEESLSRVKPVQPCPSVSLTDIIPPADTDALTAEVLDLVEELRQPQDKVMAWKRKLEQLNVCLGSEGLQGHLEPFGSCCNGFSTVSSDLDLCFSLPVTQAFTISESRKKGYLERRGPDGLQAELQMRLLDLITKALLTSGFTLEDLHSKFGARTPILCVESSDFIMDIVTRNQVGIENSRLLRTYSDFDPRVSQLGIAIKYWAKRRGLSNAVRRVLCSYAFILLVIRFLQEELVVPNLQQDYHDLPRRMCESHDCSFEDNLELYKEMRGQNPSSVGDLLVRFFRFYSLFDWRRQAVSIAILHESKPAEWRGLIAISDPFEAKRNLGDTVSFENEETIVNEFRRAYRLLCEGMCFREVCNDS